MTNETRRKLEELQTLLKRDNRSWQPSWRNDLYELEDLLKRVGPL